MKRAINLAQSQALGNCFSDAYSYGPLRVWACPPRVICCKLGLLCGDVEKQRDPWEVGLSWGDSQVTLGTVSEEIKVGLWDPTPTLAFCLHIWLLSHMCLWHWATIWHEMTWEGGPHRRQHPAIWTFSTPKLWAEHAFMLVNSLSYLMIVTEKGWVHLFWVQFMIYNVYNAILT